MKDQLLSSLLDAQLSAMGCLSRLPADIDTMRADARISARHVRWFAESIAVLVGNRALAVDRGAYRRHSDTGAGAWASWKDESQVWLRDPSSRALARLLEVSLHALPEVLRDERPATDVLFPNGSMELVEDIYKNNPVADFFNEILANAVASSLRLLQADDPGARRRILEIGAGTGGSTAHVLRRFREQGLTPDVYCYTDVSQAFLHHAQREYGQSNPFLSFRCLNINEPISAQGFEPGSYDIVVASNVLHATPNIRRVLANTKAALGRNGILVLNELSTKSLVTHLTFGLLDGWWAYEDEDVRITGSPVISPERWRKLLEAEGFRSVFFPADEAHGQGQQIVIAESDGVFTPIAPRRRGGSATRPSESLRDASADANPSVEAEGGRLEQWVRQVVRRCTSEVLQIAEEQVAIHQSFADYGVDSIVAVELVNAISGDCGIVLQTTVLFDHNTVGDLSRHIAGTYAESVAAALRAAGARHGGSVADATRGVEARAAAGDRERGTLQRDAAAGARRRARPHEPVAVVGMSGRFAKSDTLDELWAHLEKGDDLVTDVRRWDLSNHYSKMLSADEARCTRGSFIDGIDLFDPLFFNISALEAKYMDPQQRLLLEEAYHALEDAGYGGTSRYHDRCGVFVGCTSGDYQDVLPQRSPAQAFWGNATSVVPARISYFLNLRGPAVAVDTACSSSLVAIHLACQSLWMGETEMALAGGVYLHATPTFYVLAGRAGMLSPRGRCHTFGEDADGFVPGEGVGVLVLKRLDDALADGDHIRGVIRGSGVNYDGKTNGLTAPSSKSQERLLREVYETFGIGPESIQMIEAHGTGTRLGDPIEFEALVRAFRASTERTGYCALGSIKSNLGHSATAAGVAGAIKVLLSFAHAKIPASLHCERANPRINVGNSPFFLNTRTRDWSVPPGTQRRAAVSGFGFSGTNAHLVLEEAPPSVQQPRREDPGYLVALSASGVEPLRRQVDDLVRLLEKELAQRGGPPVALCADVSFTLLTGRRHLGHRLACVARDARELSNVLRGWLGDQGSPRVYTAVVNENKASSRDDLRQLGDAHVQRVASGVSAREHLDALTALADLYVRGGSFDFEPLFRDRGCRRRSLPKHPFARESFWAAAEPPRRESGAAGEAPRVAPAAHPWLQRDLTDAAGVRFAATFSGTEFFLADHVVGGHPLLPAVAYLELARAGFERALSLPRGQAFRIRNVVWSRPLAVGRAPREVTLCLDGSSNAKERVYRVESGSGAGEPCAPHGQGHIEVMTEVASIPAIDLGAARAACNQKVVEAQELYAAYRGLGIDYGPAHRGVERVYVGHGQALAQIVLPDVVASDAAAFAMHTSLMDSALQGILCLLPSGERRGALPFALQELAFFRPVAHRAWARIRRAGGDTAAAAVESATLRFDIEVCDDQGHTCVALRGFSTRLLPKRPTEDDGVPAVARDSSCNMLLTPAWEPADVVVDAPESSTRLGNVAVIGAPASWTDQLRAMSDAAFSLPVDEQDTVDAIAATLRGIPRIDHVMWVAPPGDGALSAMVARQKGGARLLFRLVKALIAEGYSGRPLEWTIVTCRAVAIHKDDVVEPTHAAVHGFVGSMAKEYAHWKIRLIDLTDPQAVTAPQVCAAPVDALGNALALRAGRSYRQELVPLTWSSFDGPSTAYRQRGVYVVVGGNGGIGGAWTEYMVRRYKAQVVWIGRRAPDASLEARLRALGELGPMPTYIRADAGNEHELRAAHAEIRERHGAVHGLVHSAIVLRDQSLASMTEEQFSASLAAKIDTSACMAAVFRGEPLDFVLFFSSMNSFMKTPGQSNYAGGCTFTDSFAAHLDQTGSLRAKVINWGYWGQVGVVAARPYRQRMEQAGIASLETADAMQALEGLLAGPLDQVAMVRLVRPTFWPGVSRTETIERAPMAVSAPDLVSAAAGAVQCDAALDEAAKSARTQVESLLTMDPMFGEALLAQLVSMGCIPAQSVADARTRGNVAASYGRWLEASFAHLERQGALAPRGPGTDAYRLRETIDVDAIARRWEARRAAWLEAPSQRATLNLVEPVLRALPEILRGARRATEVLFRGGAMSLVEEVYKHNPSMAWFNEALAATLRAFVKKSLEARPGARLRLLEVGAGTGGTSAAVFRSLAPYVDRIAEYRYTDLSKSFLTHAKASYGGENPYLTYSLCDVTRPLDEQGIELGEYDAVIASNVMHATRNVRQSLRNAKAALRGGGMLIMNEVSSNSLFTHLSFGLLEGWWSFEDPEYRLPGGPALDADMWRRACSVEGFRDLSFPAQMASDLGQQLVVAFSDGVIRRRRSTDGAVAPAAAIPERASAGQPAVAPGETRLSATAREAGVRAVVRECLGHCLELGPDQLDDDRAFSDYGVDSIIAVKLVNGIAERLGLVLETTILFDYVSVRQIAQHLLATHGDKLCLPSVRASTGAPPSHPGSSSRPCAAPEPTGAAGRAPPVEAAGHVRAVVRECLAECSESNPDQLDDERTFSDYGVDSIIAVKLVNRIAERLGLVLETTILFDHVTVEQVTRHLLATYGDRLASGPSAPALAASLDGEAARSEVTVAPIAPRPRDGREPSQPASVLPGEPGFYRRVLLSRPGQVDGIEVVRERSRALSAEEIRIAVKAFSLNFGDLLCVKGLYPNMPPYPFTPGFEASGIVIEVGDRVSSLKTGDEVIAGMGDALGAHASEIIATEDQVFHKPDVLSFEDACAMPAVAVTAVHVFRKTHPRPGERILIQTATGGTGLLVVQMAQLHGMEIIATAGSAAKLDYLARFGVSHRINYQTQDFEAEVMRLTNGQGVDVVVNTLPGDALQKGLRCLRPGGRFADLAMMALKSQKSVDLSVLNNNQSFLSVDIRRLGRTNPAELRACRDEFVRLAESGRLRGTIHGAFPMTSIRDAYRALENRVSIGKIVVHPDGARAPEEPRALVAGGISSVGEHAQVPELVHLNRTKEGKPVFWFHGAMGNVSVYQGLAREIRRPFYGLQPRGYMTDATPLEGVDAMASHYADIIGAADREGQIDLGGYSLGGILAYEVTRRLQMRGISVSSIVMLDAPDSTHLDVFSFSSRTATFQAINATLYSTIVLQPELIEQTLIHRSEVDSMLDDEGISRQLLRLARRRGLKVSEEQLQSLVLQVSRLHTSYRVSEYRVRPLPQPDAVRAYYFRNRSRSFFGHLEPYMTLIPNELSFDGVDYWSEWGRYLPNLDLRDVPSSSHMTLLSEPTSHAEIVKLCKRLYRKDAGSHGMRGLDQWTQEERSE